MNKILNLKNFIPGPKFAYSLLTNVEKGKLKLFTLTGIMISLLDILALGVLYLSVNLLSTSKTNYIMNLLKDIFNFFGIYIESKDSKNSIIIILFISAATLMIAKTIISILSQYSMVKTITKIHTNVSEKFTKAFFENSIERITVPLSQEVAFVINHGLFFTINVTLIAASAFIVEFFLIISIFVLLATWKPIIAFALLIYFSSFMYFTLNRFSKKAHYYGEQATGSYLKGNKLILESIRMHRELWTTGQHSKFNREITEQVRATSFGYSMQNFLSQLPKSTFEVAIVTGLALFSVIALLSESKTQALSGVIVFLVAGLRVGPSFIKLMGTIVALKAMQPNIERVQEFLNQNISNLEIVENYSTSKIKTSPDEQKVNIPTKFNPSLELSNVSYVYPGSKKFALSSINLSINAFQMVGITGETGSGKSTLIDICLGIKSPTSGKATLGGIDSQYATKAWPKKIAILSQKVSLIDGNAAENIALGMKMEEIDLTRVDFLVDSLELRAVFPKSDNGVHKYIGEDGFKLSGGQRQRLGLARALYWNPSLLVVDELNSSQDQLNSEKINSLLRKLSKNCTIIMISHNRSDLEYCDDIFEIKDGKIVTNKRQNF
jgi:ABC-type multidrug transport system fused ATPase/permease subunit